MSKRLLIFTKNPIPGTVKTRIGREKGHETAVLVYKKLLEYTRDVALALDAVPTTVYFNKEIIKEGIWSGSRFDRRLQVEGDLGKKMAAAFKENFQQGEDKLILIGSDCAEIKAQEIQEAFDYLDDYDVVLGPALDGGYFLIGMKKMHLSLFENMPWSSDSLLIETEKVLNSNKLGYVLLETKSDIDFWEDWEALGWTI